MTRDVLKDRESAFEYEFFHRVDLELLKRLKTELNAERERNALAESTGIRDEALLDELVSLGINDHTILALAMMPLVKTAWADGHVDKEEREAVLDAARSRAPDKAATELIELWLSKEPSPSLYKAWKDYMRDVANNVSSESRELLKDRLLEQARTVASATGGVLGIHKISKAEKDILADIEAAFNP